MEYMESYRGWICAFALFTRPDRGLRPTESAEAEAEGGGGISKKMNIRNSLDKEFEAMPLKQVPDLPVSALSILPPEGGAGS